MIKLKNKHPLIRSIILLLSITGCSKGDSVNPAGEQPYTLTIAVQEKSSLQTRTSVFDPDDNTLKGRQHVTRIQLYVYEQDDSGTDYTCVATEDVKWEHLQGAMDGLETKKQKYNTQYQGYKEGMKYRFVAMGYDDTYSGSSDTPTFDNANSVAAYGDPATQAAEGDKLSAGTFSLQGGADISLINQSELFAGAQTFTKTELKNGTAVRKPIELNRRVAGVLGYFKGLPEKIENTAVAKVILRLYAAQNTKVNFLPVLPTGYVDSKSVPDAEYTDYITSPYHEADKDGHIIATYNTRNS